MATNFRLSYNAGADYTELMPVTKIEAIEGTENILGYSTVNLKIPAHKGLTQTIAMPLTDAQAEAPFIVTLTSAGPKALRAYYSIDQIEATKTGFTITRLNEESLTSIDVTILFKERGVNVG